MYVSLIAYFWPGTGLTISHSPLISYVFNTVMFLNETWLCNYNTGHCFCVALIPCLNVSYDIRSKSEETKSELPL